MSIRFDIGDTVIIQGPSKGTMSFFDYALMSDFVGCEATVMEQYGYNMIYNEVEYLIDIDDGRFRWLESWLLLAGGCEDENITDDLMSFLGIM